MEQRFEIATDRLILRHPVMSDARMINDAKNKVWRDLQTWMSWAHHGQQQIEATESFIANLGAHSLIGLCRDSQKFVVSGGLMPVSEGVYATGYWVAKDFLGQGYATEATAAAIHYAFHHLHAKAIHISYFEGNEKSRRIIEKLGFSNEVVTRKSFARCLDGTMMDEHSFVMTYPSVLPPTAYESRGRW